MELESSPCARVGDGERDGIGDGSKGLRVLQRERERGGREGQRYSIELVGQWKAAVGETRRTTTMTIVRHVKSLFHDDCPRR